MPDPLLPPTLAVVWGVEVDDHRRGPKPRLDLATIVRAGIEVADEQGGPSLSGVARRLGVSTNALYRYLGSRAEFDALVADAALGTPPPATNGDWPQRVRAWVAALRQRHRLHTWLAGNQGVVPMLPHTLGWLDALLDALKTGGFQAGPALAAASIIDGYVRAMAVRDRTSDPEFPQPAWVTPDNLQAVAGLAGERDLRHVSDVLRGGMFEANVPLGEAGFDAGLEVILAGLANWL